MFYVLFVYRQRASKYGPSSSPRGYTPLKRETARCSRWFKYITRSIQIQNLLYIQIHNLLYIQIQYLLYIQIQNLLYIQTQNLLYIKIQNVLYIQIQSLYTKFTLYSNTKLTLYSNTKLTLYSNAKLTLYSNTIIALFKYNNRSKNKVHTCASLSENANHLSRKWQLAFNKQQCNGLWRLVIK